MFNLHILFLDALHKIISGLSRVIIESIFTVKLIDKL